MTLRPKRVVRPVKQLPTAKIVKRETLTSFPFLDEFLHEWRNTPDNVIGVSKNGSTRYRNFTPGVLPNNMYPTVICDGRIRQAQDRHDSLGYNYLYRQPDTLGPAFWPSHFGFSYGQLMDPVDIAFEPMSDVTVRQQLERFGATHVFSQSIYMDYVTNLVGLRVSRTTALTDNMRDRLLRPNVRYKIYGMVNRFGEVLVFPPSAPHLRLIHSIQLYVERYKLLPPIRQGNEHNEK